MAARGPGTGAWPVRALGPAVQALMTGRHEPDESRDSRPDLWGAAAEMPPPTRQDRKRRLDYECTSFTFLGYTFRARKAPTRDGRSMFAAFLPAISGDALKDKGRIIRGWRINLRTTSDLKELAEWLNPVIRGWMNYYGKFYRTEMFALLRRINTYIVRWARRKFKRLRAFKRAKRWWNGLLQREPQLFVHWAWMPEF